MELNKKQDGECIVMTWVVNTYLVVLIEPKEC